MNKKARVLFFIFMLIACACGQSAPQATSTADIPIRIGWQTTWATQGQIAQTLMHTNVLSKNGLEGSFVGVSYGAPLNEAALADEVDVIFTADQPAAALLARTPDWVIIGRLMFNRVGLYVPPESPIKMVADLKGKTIAMPFGAAAQRVALKAIAETGLDPTQDITAINLDITEQAAVIQKGTLSSWGDIDAMAGFDPTMAVFETTQTARMLHIGQVTSVIVMSKMYIQKYPEAPTHFLKAFQEASFYYATHVSDANEWFREASQLTFDDTVLTLSASVEPNLNAKVITDIDLQLTPGLIDGLQEAADFVYQMGLAKQQITMPNHIDMTYVREAEAAFAEVDYDPSSVKVAEP